VYNIDTGILKSELYGWLKLLPNDAAANGEKTYPNGYCHFPERDAEYFKSLVSEKLVRLTDKKGQIKYYWQKTQARNEALDCRVYARAAAEIFGISYLSEEHWKSLHLTIPQSVRANNAAGEEVQQPKKKRESIW
jgi:phage terminase large subunit GpA-like protein